MWGGRVRLEGCPEAVEMRYDFLGTGTATEEAKDRLGGVKVGIRCGPRVRRGSEKVEWTYRDLHIQN